MDRCARLRVASALVVCLVAASAFAQERRPVDVPPRSHIVGVVVDSSGKPLANVRATLDSVGGAWAAGVEPPKLARNGYESQGFEAQSNADGHFEFDVVTPTADWVSLSIWPDVYHDLAGREFGPAGGRDQPRLLAGDNDLGQFVLAATGAVAGRVLDGKGLPIAGAEVRLDDSFPGGRSRSGRSDAAGAFTIEHVPAGKYGIEALRDGFKLAKRAALDVRVRETSAAGDIMLEISPTISGIVVDEQGNAIANARVWGWPEKSGTGAGARADAQGRFTVALKQVEPHYFEVEAEGFAKLEARGFPFGESKAHPVGATDVRLVMKRPVMTTFVVVDSATSQPVTRYVVSLAWRPTPTGSRGGGEPKYELADHPGGEFTCEADPALFDYVITAPGYGPAKGQVSHASASSPRCVVKLWGGTAISGRVVFGGEPVARAALVLRPQSLVRMNEDEGGGPFDENDAFWMPIDGQWDPFSWDEEPRKAYSETDGRFAFTDLDAKEYRLEVLDHGARRSVDPIAAFVGEPVDLGDIELLAPATLRGRVLVPDGVTPDGIDVTGFVFDQRGNAKTDKDGRFEITAPSGRWHVVVFPHAGKLAYGSGAELVYELAAGATKEIELDLRDRAGCYVRLEVRVNGKPDKKLMVVLKSASDGRIWSRIDAMNERESGPRWVNAVGAVDADVTSPSRMPLGRFVNVGSLVAGHTEDISLDCTCGALEFAWPLLPDGETLQQVEFSAPVVGGKETWNPVFFAEHPLIDRDVHGILHNGCVFERAAAGEYDWTARVISRSRSTEFIERFYRKSVRVTADGTARCAFTDRDRVQGQ